MGVDIGEPGFGAYTPTNVARVYKTETGNNYVVALESLMAPYVENGQIAVYMNTFVDSLVTDGDIVTGVTALGETYTAKGGVILATGGYGYNKEWVEMYNFAHSRSSSPTTSTGSGYTMAAEVGAAFSNMETMSESTECRSYLLRER